MTKSLTQTACVQKSKAHECQMACQALRPSSTSAPWAGPAAELSPGLDPVQRRLIQQVGALFPHTEDAASRVQRPVTHCGRT